MKRCASRSTEAGNSSGLVQSVLGVNSKPSRCCVLVLRGQAAPIPSFDGKVDASARFTRGQCTAVESSALVLTLYSGIAWCSLCYFLPHERQVGERQASLVLVNTPISHP